MNIFDQSPSPWLTPTRRSVATLLLIRLGCWAAMGGLAATPVLAASDSPADPAQAVQAAVPGTPAKTAAAPEPTREPSDDEGSGRSFLYKEIVVSGFYSFPGVTGLPAGNTSRKHFELSPRPPGNYIGVDYVRTFTLSSPVNKFLPEWLPLTAMDLHPRLVYERAERQRGLEPLRIAPQDFWVRFNPGKVDRLALRVGEFVIPYGANPIMAPRQSFILPVEATDLGLKWDWGVDLKGPLGQYDWEVALTTGTGEGVNMPRCFDGPDRKSYLVTGRLGSPAYWNFQQGLSFLYGDLPGIMGPIIYDDNAVSRWRVGYDAFYKYGTYLMVGAQATFGQDGFGGDQRFVGATAGRQAADVLGYRLWADWIVPPIQNLRLQFQFESLYRDLGTSRSDDTAAIFQAAYSFTTAFSAVVSFRKELGRAMGDRNDAIYLTFIYYSR